MLLCRTRTNSGSSHWGRSGDGRDPRLNAKDPQESAALEQPKNWRILVEADPTRVCEMLVGLRDAEVLGADDDAG